MLALHTVYGLRFTVYCSWFTDPGDRSVAATSLTSLTSSTSSTSFTFHFPVGNKLHGAWSDNLLRDIITGRRTAKEVGRTAGALRLQSNWWDRAGRVAGSRPLLPFFPFIHSDTGSTPHTAHSHTRTTEVRLSAWQEPSQRLGLLQRSREAKLRRLWSNPLSCATHARDSATWLPAPGNSMRANQRAQYCQH